MKKIILGISLGLIFTALATVQTGEVIRADLINKILDLKIYKKENISSARVFADGTITHKSSDWISTCTWLPGNVGASCPIVGFTEKPLCWANYDSGSGSQSFAKYDYVNSSNTTAIFNVTLSTNGAATTQGIILVFCQNIDANGFVTIRSLLEDAGFVF